MKAKPKRKKAATPKAKSKDAKAAAIVAATKRLKTLNALTKKQRELAGTKSVQIPRISHREAQKRAGRVRIGNHAAAENINTSDK